MIRQYRKKKLLQALEFSYQDLEQSLEKLSKSKDPKALLNLLKNGLNSSVWISKNATGLAWSHLKKNTLNSKVEKPDPLQTSLLLELSKGIDIPKTKATNAEIFQAIFKDRCLGHIDPNYNSPLDFEIPSCTLVLVPGVFNELFTTASFERGARHLSKTKGLKYFIPKIHGAKSSDTNAALIEQQLKDFHDHNPDEKLWLLAFSKGGLDTLRFLQNNNEFANSHILGLTTVATPILGTNHFDHRLIKLANKIHSFEGSNLYRFIDKKIDILFKEIQNSLISENQEEWFNNNHEQLPNNIFYQALALEANWYQSHFWMIITKAFLQSKSYNDGVIDIENAFFPDYFKATNLWVISGHHLIGNRSSKFNQEAFLESLIIFQKVRGTFL